MLAHYLHVFAGDQKLHAVAYLIVADVILGVLAATVDCKQAFSLARVADFLHDDVLGKVLPWFGLYALGISSSASLGVAGVNVDLSQLADGAFVAVAAALAASLYGSLKELGFTLPGLPAGVTGSLL